MLVWLINLGLPLLVFLILSLMPQGRLATGLCFLIGGLTGVFWGAYMLGRGRLEGVVPDFSLSLLIFMVALTLAFVLGASLQVMRRRFPPAWPIWAWPTCVVLTLMAVGLPLMRILGA